MTLLSHRGESSVESGASHPIPYVPYIRDKAKISAGRSVKRFCMPTLFLAPGPQATSRPCSEGAVLFIYLIPCFWYAFTRCSPSCTSPPDVSIRETSRNVPDLLASWSVFPAVAQSRGLGTPTSLVCRDTRLPALSLLSLISASPSILTAHPLLPVPSRAA